MAVRGYSKAQIRLHWIVAVLVGLQFLFHDGISDAFEDGIETAGAGGLVLTGPATAHVAAGGLILLLAVVRLLLRQGRGAPPPPEGDPGWQKAAAAGTHLALYALLLAIPVTGAVAWGGASEGAADVHEALTTALLVLVAAHILGALYGQFLQRTGILRRMVRPED